MKRLALFMAVIMVAGLAYAEQDISWVEMVHDFGAIDEEGGAATCRFSFVNRGKKPVVVIGARASCGCTTPRYSINPVAPGDTGVVSVTYNPEGRPGRFSKRVKIDTSDGDGEALKSNLEIRGVVIGASNTLRSRYPVEAGPVNLRSTTAAFGEVKKSGYKTAYVEVYNHSGDTLHPYFDKCPAYISYTTATPCLGPAELSTYVLSINAAKLNDYGIVTDSLMFYPDRGAQPVPIEIVAIVREDFSRMTPQAREKAPVAKLSDDIVNFGKISRDGAELTATFEILNRGKDPLLVRRVYTTDPGVRIIAVPQKIKKGKSEKVTVAVDPAKVTGELLNARIQVITNDPDNPVQTIRAVGEF